MFCFKRLINIFIVSYLFFNFPQAISLDILFGSDDKICLEAVDRIKEDSVFFERVKLEGYQYILLNSPFKRKSIEYIPATLAYSIALDARGKYLKSIATSGSCFENSFFIYDDLESRYDCEENIRKYGYELGFDPNQYFDYFINVYDYSTEFLNDLEGVVAYKINLRSSNEKLRILHIVGVLGNPKSFIEDDKYGQQAIYFITDEYMRSSLENIGEYENGKSYIMEKGVVYSGVPIDLFDNTFGLEMYQDYNDRKNIVIDIYRNIYKDNSILSELICKFKN